MLVPSEDIGFGDTRVVAIVKAFFVSTLSSLRNQQQKLNPKSPIDVPSDCNATARPPNAVTMASSSDNEPILRLPHPYQTPYGLVKTSQTTEGSIQLFQIKTLSVDSKSALPPETLHNDRLFFTEPVDLKSSERPPESNNTPWSRARRSPCSTWVWDGETAPTLGQAWLLIYMLFTLRPSMEGFRLLLSGTGKEDLAKQLKTVLLAIDHPIATGLTDELLVPRSTFWQGAGSPFGPRTAWIPEDTIANKPFSSYPITPLENVMTAEPGQVLTWHPRRPAKPRPGSVIYSRWIPHLRENFSMVALDWEDPEHLRLFHEWQNDPRVSQGWNETGTLDQHREYLRKAHVDPHQVTMLARFDDTYFAYFEVYWGKVRNPNSSLTIMEISIITSY